MIILDLLFVYVFLFTQSQFVYPIITISLSPTLRLHIALFYRISLCLCFELRDLVKIVIFSMLF
jgi:hypothetical protein